MPYTDLKSRLKSHVANLEDLVVYLEDCGTLGSEEHQYCQLRLQGALEQLKQLQRMAGYMEDTR